MGEKFDMKVDIAGFNFVMNINRSEEEIYRKAMKLANSYFEKYDRSIEKMETAPKLALALYDLAKNYIILSNNSDESLLLEISELSELIDEYLKET